MDAAPPPLELIQQLELRLLQPALRQAPEAAAELLAEDFLEFGASGQVFDKPAALAALQAETPAVITVTDFQTRSLAPGVVLTTYRARRVGAAAAWRASLWKLTAGRWQVVFHQGTPAPEP